MLTVRSPRPPAALPRYPGALAGEAPFNTTSERGTTPTSTRTARRIDALDGVRGLAILMVVAFHCSLSAIERGGDGLVLRAATSLWCGVDLFFVLSGFLITGILLDSRDDEHYFRNFYARRTLRIFPLYYGVLLVLALVPMVSPRTRSMEMLTTLRQNQVWFWTYATNVRVALTHSWDNVVPGRLNHFWSLAVEEQFYLVWPLVVLLAGRRRLLWVSAAIVIGSLTVRLSLIAADPGTAGAANYTPNIAGYVLLPARADSLAIGAIVACLLRSPRGYAALRRLARPVAWTSGIALAVLLLRSGKLWEYDPVVEVIGYPMLAFAFAALVVVAIDPSRGTIARGFEWRPLRRVGRYAYAIYIFHYPLIYFLVAAGWGPERYFGTRASMLPGALVFGAVAFTLSLGIAMVSWRFYEAPILSLSRFFRATSIAESVTASTETPRAAVLIPDRA